jgi:hypothetical protein
MGAGVADSIPPLRNSTFVLEPVVFFRWVSRVIWDNIRQKAPVADCDALSLVSLKEKPHEIL